MSAAPPVPAWPFFLDADPGRRYCLYHAPAMPCRGAYVYLHPFAEEMNKSRRMAARQSRLLAAHGFAVLQIDLYGCGDSSGDFDQARWDIWLQDTALAREWLEQRTQMRAGLWGLRLGALLAAEHAASVTEPPPHLLLWQPVTDGAQHLTQFLRLRIARDMLDGNGQPVQQGSTDLRASLARGRVEEIAGYPLAPALAAAIDACSMRMPSGSRVAWFEVGQSAGRNLPAPRQQLLDDWRAQGVQLKLHRVQGPAFWNTQEISECPELLAATLASVEAV